MDGFIARQCAIGIVSTLCTSGVNIRRVDDCELVYFVNLWCRRQRYPVPHAAEIADEVRWMYDLIAWSTYNRVN